MSFSYRCTAPTIAVALQRKDGKEGVVVQKKVDVATLLMPHTAKTLEAYANQENKGYLGRRQHYAWLWRAFNAGKYEENWS